MGSGLTFFSPHFLKFLEGGCYSSKACAFTKQCPRQEGKGCKGRKSLAQNLLPFFVSLPHFHEWGNSFSEPYSSQCPVLCYCTWTMFKQKTMPRMCLILTFNLIRNASMLLKWGETMAFHQNPLHDWGTYICNYAVIPSTEDSFSPKDKPQFPGSL